MSQMSIPEALTFDDILLVPAHSSVLPREVSLNTHLTRSITVNVPILSSAMDTVTEARLAIALAQEGGLGIIHKNMSIAQQAKEVQSVKKFESGVVRDPITVTPESTVGKLIDIAQKHHFSGVPVVTDGILQGIVTNRDVRFETNLELPVSAVMTPKERLITVKEGTSREAVIELLHKHRIEKILVVDDQFHLRGLITVKDIQKAKDNPLACKDDDAQLCVGAAVGISQNTEARVTALIEAGADVIVADTAHGHSQAVVNKIRWIKKKLPHLATHRWQYSHRGGGFNIGQCRSRCC